MLSLLTLLWKFSGLGFKLKTDTVSKFLNPDPDAQPSFSDASKCIGERIDGNSIFILNSAVRDHVFKLPESLIPYDPTRSAHLNWTAKLGTGLIFFGMSQCKIILKTNIRHLNCKRNINRSNSSGIPSLNLFVFNLITHLVRSVTFFQLAYIPLIKLYTEFVYYIINYIYHGL